MTWQMGILADRAGHVHLGAVTAGSAHRAREYIELLAPAGAARPTEADLEQLVVLVHGQHVADLRRLVAQCIDDDRLRRKLIDLIDHSAPADRRSHRSPVLAHWRAWSKPPARLPSCARWTRSKPSSTWPRRHACMPRRRGWEPKPSNHAMEIKLWAERRAGELLRMIPR